MVVTGFPSPRFGSPGLCGRTDAGGKFSCSERSVSAEEGKVTVMVDSLIVARQEERVGSPSELLPEADPDPRLAR